MSIGTFGAVLLASFLACAVTTIGIRYTLLALAAGVLVAVAIILSKG